MNLEMRCEENIGVPPDQLVTTNRIRWNNTRNMITALILNLLFHSRNSNQQPLIQNKSLVHGEKIQAPPNQRFFNIRTYFKSALSPRTPNY